MKTDRVLHKTSHSNGAAVYKDDTNMVLTFWDAKGVYPDQINVVATDDEAFYMKATSSEQDLIAEEMQRNEDLSIKGLRFLCGLEGPLGDLVTDEELRGVLFVGSMDVTTFNQIKSIAERRHHQQDRSRQ